MKKEKSIKLSTEKAQDITFVADQINDIETFTKSVKLLRDSCEAASLAYKEALRHFVTRNLTFSDDKILEQELVEFGREYIDHLSQPCCIYNATLRVDFWEKYIESCKGELKADLEALTS